ncbi:unnamed protein product [Schistosoma mattheei]|uniref:Uncharacterized protein n=1 Tax=Schistosoma mattheei TaxID=31246 RepID=A0A183Q1S9_9TREM|nr:unnamed protein product [Schistosoma mattheei]
MGRICKDENWRIKDSIPTTGEHMGLKTIVSQHKSQNLQYEHQDSPTGFFRRTEGSSNSLVCVGGQNACTITPRSRNACKSCRFRRCLAAGMSKKGRRSCC